MLTQANQRAERLCQSTQRVVEWANREWPRHSQ